MKTYRFTGEIIFTEPFHIGSGQGNDFIDSLVMKDSDDKPFIPGTSIGGIISANARNVLRLHGNSIIDADRHPVFRALFGSASEKDSSNRQRGRESRLVVHDCKLISGGVSFVQDRNSINRHRESAEQDHLFRDEVISKASRFAFACDFRERPPLGLPEEDEDINSKALILLLGTLDLLQHGWAYLGGKRGTGHGRFELQKLNGFIFDRTNPDDVLKVVLYGIDSLKDNNAFDLAQKPQIVLEGLNQQAKKPEVLVLKGLLRPYEPLLVKSGMSLEEIRRRGSQKAKDNPISALKQHKTVDELLTIDSAFCMTPDNMPYIPGSSLRGVMRSWAEKMIRTFIFNRFQKDDIALQSAWDLQRLKEHGNALSEVKSFDQIYQKACIVSRLFGFTALGSRVVFSDALPVKPQEFKKGLKLLDHVAIDRFTGGAADKKKFNAQVFFPYCDLKTNEPDDSGDMEFRIVLEDFEPWQLGLIALLLKDLHLGNINIGYGRKKGNGKVRLVSGHTRIEALTNQDGLLKTQRGLGGFIHIPEFEVKADTHFWVHRDSPLYPLLQEAVSEFRELILSWNPEDAEVKDES